MSLKINDRCADLSVCAFPSSEDETVAKTSKGKFFKKTDAVKIRVGVFFDGTENNMYNTEARLEYEKGVKEFEKRVNQSLNNPLTNTTNKDYVTINYDSQKADIYKQRIDDDDSGSHIVDSYANYYTNVVRLFKNYKTGKSGDIEIGRVYIEGIGTKAYEGDSTPGKAFGTGEYGIPERVKEACEILAKEIQRLANGKKIFELKIDVFGFSRGAAAARNFIHEVSKQEQDLSDYNHEFVGQQFEYIEAPPNGALGKALLDKQVKFDGELEIVFAGLFDTVPTYVPITSPTNSFRGNDKGTSDLNLTAVSKAKNVLHLTAMDERRTNFALVNIASKGLKYEKALPGVHCDVGGGYNPIVKEINRHIYEGTKENIHKEVDSLIKLGWFKDKGDLDYEVKEIIRRGPAEIEIGKLKIKYRSVRNDYCFIPLHIMKEKANKIKGGMFKASINELYEIPDEEVLKNTYTRLRNYVIDGEGGPMKFYTAEELNLPSDGTPVMRLDPTYSQKIDDHYALKELRQKYFHTSHHCNIYFLETGWGDKYKGAFGPYKPSINDKPSREIISG